MNCGIRLLILCVRIPQCRLCIAARGSLIGIKCRWRVMEYSDGVYGIGHIERLGHDSAVRGADADFAVTELPRRVRFCITEKQEIS